MLLLVFEIQGCAYAVDLQVVTQVVPRIALRKLPHVPNHVVGALDRGGRPIPVVDLGILLHDAESPHLLSTRILIVRLERGSHTVDLGLIAERVGELRDVTIEGDAFITVDSTDRARSCLGRVVRLDGLLVQLILVDRILSGDERELLYDVMLGSGA